MEGGTVDFITKLVSVFINLTHHIRSLNVLFISVGTAYTKGATTLLNIESVPEKQVLLDSSDENLNLKVVTNEKKGGSLKG